MPSQTSVTPPATAPLQPGGDAPTALLLPTPVELGIRMPSRGTGRSGSGPSHYKPPTLRLRRVLQLQQRERRSSVKGSSSSSGFTSGTRTPPCADDSVENWSSDSKKLVNKSSGSKRKARKSASQSVRLPPSVSSSSSSSLPTECTDSGYSGLHEDRYSGLLEELGLDSDYDSDASVGFELDERGKQFASIAHGLPCHGLMLLLLETPSGFALFTFGGVYCYLDDSVDKIWAEFGDRNRASLLVFPKGFLSFEDKSSAITDAAVDKQLVDLIKRWHHPGMNLCVGNTEYKRIIESVLKIPCMCCETVMEILWGVQQQMSVFVPQEKSKLTKEDRLPMSRGLQKFLSNYGYDVKPEMVNEKIVTTACSLFHCDVDDERNLGILRDAGVSIRDISGFACEDWDILKLAIAVKVMCCPKEELTEFREVLAEDVLSKLKGDARKYKGIPTNILWLTTSRDVVSNHHLRIAKKKLLGSLVKKAKKAYEAEQAEVCEKGKLQGESEQIPQEHEILVNRCSSGLPPRPHSLPTTPSAPNPSTCLAGDPSICLSSDEGTTRKRRRAPLGLLQWTIEMLGSLVKRPRRF